MQRDLNLWYVYLKIQILGIIKIQSQESCGIAHKDMQVKKLEFCFWDTTHCIDKFPPHFPWCPVPRGGCPTSCTASCSGTPFSQSRSSTSSSMFVGLSCILVLMASYASQICSRTQQTPSESPTANRQTGKPAPIHPLPILKVSKGWVHSSALVFSFPIHINHCSSDWMRLPKKEEGELQVCSENDDNNRFRQSVGRSSCLYSSYPQRKQKDFSVVY